MLDTTSVCIVGVASLSLSLSRARAGRTRCRRGARSTRSTSSSTAWRTLTCATSTTRSSTTTSASGASIARLFAGPLLSVRKTPFVQPALYTKRSVYQDTLETNIGKFEKKEAFFSLQWTTVCPWSGRKVRKSPLFCTKNDHFAKTGSGQT
eukprot:COSAG06_NODE_1543_length_9141_cov_4.266202_12_plen_151_part_00